MTGAGGGGGGGVAKLVPHMFRYVTATHMKTMYR